MLYFAFPAIALFVVYGTMSIKYEMAYNKSFETVYKIKNYNDSRIDFYNNELEKNYKKYVHAKSTKEIFESDTKIDLASECIQYYLEANDENDWINVRSNMRKNARNKYANNDELVKQAKSNAHQTNLNFYLYDLNKVNDITEDITDSWNYKSKKSKCDENLTAEQMYTIFLPIYVDEYTDNLTVSRVSSKILSDEIYIKRESWLKEITDSCSKCPKYETFQNRLISRKLEAESSLFAMAKGKIKMGNFAYMVRRYKVNLNIIDDEGKTPLFYLAKSKKGKYYIKNFIKHGADIFHKDNYGKTVFDYFDKNTSHYIIEALETAKKK